MLPSLWQKRANRIFLGSYGHLFCTSRFAHVGHPPMGWLFRKPPRPYDHAPSCHALETS